jgi:hypothetical protein
MQAHPLANSPSISMESKVRASQHRDWVIKLELERTSSPKVCRPKLVISDRPGSGKNGRDQLRLVRTVTYEPKQKGQPPATAKTQEPGKATEVSGDENAPATEHEVNSHDVADNEATFAKVDEDGWPILSSFEADESSLEESTDSQETTFDVETTSDQERFDPNYRYVPANLSEGEKHTFIHTKLSGLAEWGGDFATVLVGNQKIEFVVPTFVLTDNLEFFRAVFEAGRWSEGMKNTVALEEESSVDFVLLLRFLVHNMTKDFNEVEDPCYPFWLGSNPRMPNEEAEEDTTIAPWILRVVAMAERLCFIGPKSRLTEVLDATLKPAKADRLTPALMDWLFDNSAKESVLRNWVYNRLLQSLVSGDVNPTVYKDYAKGDPELMTMLLNGSFEHPLALNSSFQPFLTTQCKSLANGDLLSARSSLVGGNFELAWPLFVGMHRYIHHKTPACVKTEHVWNWDAGWVGCKGMCIGCWNKDLGGTQQEIARVLLVEEWLEEVGCCDDSE